MQTFLKKFVKNWAIGSVFLAVVSMLLAGGTGAFGWSDLGLSVILGAAAAYPFTKDSVDETSPP